MKSIIFSSLLVFSSAYAYEGMNRINCSKPLDTNPEYSVQVTIRTEIVLETQHLFPPPNNLETEAHTYQNLCLKDDCSMFDPQFSEYKLTKELSDNSWQLEGSEAVLFGDNVPVKMLIELVRYNHPHGEPKEANVKITNLKTGKTEDFSACSIGLIH